ncbi:hypothetical protein GUJ93_ZPchr0011g27776 [Zizania palustris]|uniref:Uncharacterized protein n=1 Tax=Zizania palustris TaxID=103762 RepID=A0A8J6BKP5_ZIZPA|nr:hypothetical protein GUJ93_ZPchr0011g27776 [Zizania palustris]
MSSVGSAPREAMAVSRFPPLLLTPPMNMMLPLLPTPLTNMMLLLPLLLMPCLIILPMPPCLIVHPPPSMPKPGVTSKRSRITTAENF